MQSVTQKILSWANVRFARFLKLAPGVTVALAVILPGAIQAQTYPTQSIKMVVPFGPGSATDTLARLIGDHMASTLGVSVVVENKSGALGTIGANQVAKATPDGYTLLVGTNTTNAAIKAFVKSVPYDPQKDFAPISFLGELTQILVVGKDSEFKDVKELLAYARSNPGKLTYAWSNTVGRMATAMLAQQAELDLMDVPYKEAGSALMDVMAGRIDFAIDNAISTSSHIKSNSLRPLAVSSQNRLPYLPDVPTIAESAQLPDYEVKAFFALFAPAGTPEDIVQLLSKAVQEAGKDEAIRNRLTAMGMEVLTGTPEALGNRIDTEIVKWTESARSAGIKPL